MPESEFTVLKWPTQSPGLSPVKHLWDLVEREIHIGSAYYDGLIQASEFKVKDSWFDPWRQNPWGSGRVLGIEIKYASLAVWFEDRCFHAAWLQFYLFYGTTKTNFLSTAALRQTGGQMLATSPVWNNVFAAFTIFAYSKKHKGMLTFRSLPLRLSVCFFMVLWSMLVHSDLTVFIGLCVHLLLISENRRWAGGGWNWHDYYPISWITPANQIYSQTKTIPKIIVVTSVLA